MFKLETSQPEMWPSVFLAGTASLFCMLLEPSSNLKWKALQKGATAGTEGGKGTPSNYLPVSSQQLSGLLQVCVRTGTETQAKFTSAELLREYILVRNEGTAGTWHVLMFL